MIPNKIKPHSSVPSLSLWLLCLFCLSGCSPILGQGQSTVSQNEQAALSQISSIGQSFTSRHAGLSGIEIYFKSGAQLSGSQITLHLRENSQTTADILSAQLELNSVGQPGFYRFNFSPQSASYMQDYYMQLELKGAGTLQLGAASGNSYQDGALYINGIPADRQLAFQQVYAPSRLAFGMAWQILQWLWLILLAALVFVLPGWALMSGVWPGWKDLDWGEKAGLAAGVSLALSPVCFLWMNVPDLRLGIFFAVIPIVAGGSFLLWKNRLILLRFPFNDLARWKQVDVSSIGLIIALACVIAIRLWVVRGIDYPMWGDSYQHTMITQLILDQKGLFQSWSPYVPYTTLTVQYGFPAMVAMYALISGVQAPQATLWVGQIINALAILALYPLMLRISGKRRWAGIAAIIAAGLWIPMPMQYVNWGRYAQLGGQAILPVAIWLCWEAFSQPRFSLKRVILTGMVVAGMLLTYYRMFFYFSTFFLVWIVTWGLPEWRLKLKPWKGLVISAFVTILTIFLILVPWLIRVSTSSLASSVEGGLTSVNVLENILNDYSVWNGVIHYVPPAILAFSAAAFLWSLVRRKWIAAGMALWVAGMASLVAGRLIHLPGANLMQNFAVVIFLYIPASLLTGWGFGEIAQWFEHGFWKKGKYILLLIAAGMSIWGAYGFRNISEPGTYQYVAQPDLRAAAWIRANISSDAIFLVEGYRIYGGKSAVGSDGGWWLPLIAGRRNTMPPQYALLNENSQLKEYSQKVVDLIATLEDNPPNTPSGLAAICQMGVTHVYVGQGQGLVGFGVKQLYNRELLQKSDKFTEIYHQDRVSIFSIKPQACQNLTNIQHGQ